MMQGMNVLALVKGEERYVFLYDDCPGSRQALLNTIAKMTADPDFSLTRRDARLLVQRIDKLQKEPYVDGEDDCA